MTLTQIAKRCRDSWRAWAQIDDENEDGDGLPDDMTREWVDWHLMLCDAVIEAEVRLEELSEFERLVRATNHIGRPSACVDSLERVVEWLDGQRGQRNGVQP